MLIPGTERETLIEVMAQAEKDLKSAHAEICKLQGLDPAKHDWPEWTPQANSIRWFKAIREKFALDGHCGDECSPDDKGSLRIIQEKDGRATIAVRAPKTTHEAQISIPWSDWLVLREAGQ